MTCENGTHYNCDRCATPCAWLVENAAAIDQTRRETLARWIIDEAAARMHDIMAGEREGEGYEAARIGIAGLDTTIIHREFDARLALLGKRICGFSWCGNLRGEYSISICALDDLLGEHYTRLNYRDGRRTLAGARG